MKEKIEFDKVIFDIVELLSHENVKGRFQMMCDSQGHPVFIYENAGGVLRVYPMSAILSMRRSAIAARPLPKGVRR